MKKVISILVVLIVLAGAVFAASGDSITINATVAEHKPGFKIFGGTSAAALNTAAGGTVSTGMDIALENITVYFKLTQYSPNTAESYTGTKAKFRGVATLTVTAEPLSTTIGTGANAATFSTANPTCADATVASISGITSNPAPSNGSNTVVFTLNYDGRSIQDADVATFNFTWTAKDELPPAEVYSADVTLTYTVV